MLFRLRGSHDNQDQSFVRQKERSKQAQALTSFEKKKPLSNRMFLVYLIHLSEEPNSLVRVDCSVEFHRQERRRQEMRPPFEMQTAHVE